MLLKFRLLTLVLALGIATPLAAQTASTKIDEALVQSLKAGCTTEKVIIRTKHGYRTGLSATLQTHGDTVVSEYPSIDAVAAEVHCGDLRTMEGFASVLSISKDAVVRADAAPAGATTGKGRRRHATRVDRPAPRPIVKVKAPKSTPVAPPAESIDPRQKEGQDAAKLQAPLFESLGIKGPRDYFSGSVMLGEPTSQSGNYDFFREWLGASARSIGVAVIDSGIDPMVDFGARITYFYDFTKGKISKAKPSDAYGHGTHVAGLIGSSFIGIAPDVRLVGLKVLDGKGQGQTSDVLRAIEFATANKDLLGIRILNLSLGHPVFEPAATDPLVQAVERAVRAGLVVVTSAGNFGVNPQTHVAGYAGTCSPGNAPSAITVGALQTFDTISRRDDRVASFSSKGPTWYDGFAKPDVVAPGFNVLSLAAPRSYLRKLNELRGGTGDYMRLSGTSMSAGISSGIVALLLETNPGLTPNALKAVLEFTAIPVKDNTGKPYDALTQGAGSVNGSGAVILAGAIDASQPVGSKWLTMGVNFQTVIGGETLSWAQLMIWGEHRVMGDGVIDENRPAWATNIVWGDGTDSDNIVWGTAGVGDGDNIVWGTAYDDGDNIVWGTNFVWSDDGDNIVWGTMFFEDDNIVWGTNIVWGNALLGVTDGDNIVWGTASGGDGDNIVWGTVSSQNIVWGNLFDSDNIVWGTSEEDGDNIVWGTSIIWGDSLVIGRQPAPGHARRAQRVL